MLRWEMGARPEDGVWAKYWYKNVHASSGFQPYVDKDLVLEDRFKPLYEAALPLYQKLLSAV